MAFSWQLYVRARHYRVWGGGRLSSQHEMDGNGVRNKFEAILFTYIRCTIQDAPRNILNVFVFSW